MRPNGRQQAQAVGVRSGRQAPNLLAELDRIGFAVDKDDPRLSRLLDEVKEREAIGYAYEAADASFELLARRLLGKVPRYFEVEKFDVNVEQRLNAKGERVSVSQAVVKVKVGDELLISAAEGNGPVNALDVALRKDLGKYQSYITGLELTDYRVRILNAGTEAVTRVLIESDRRNRRALDDHRRLAEHHRRVVPGADGFDRLQAREIRRAGVKGQGS